jgi:flagellar biosynthesis/type III secretory pathway protein FliH
MAVPLDDAYFMTMTGIWKMSDLESWVEARMEEAVEASKDDFIKEGYDEGHSDGRKEGIDETLGEVEDAIASLRKHLK